MSHYPEYLYPWQSSPPAPPLPPQPAPAHPDIPGHHGDLRKLRSAYRRLRRVATLTALGYFTLFLVLSAFAPGLMGGELPGGLNPGLLLGLCQLPVTLVAIAVYERSARRRVDPLAEHLRRQGRTGRTGRTGRPV
ncbi:hypothetical protein BGM19_16420 [Streptomyces agglomeratus]|uniref:DUF485 domain-containing protein n=1 Tax=Streptomyces agglomeratus TaxID=285458 RepID=UPI00086D40BD|nr:DUF485 domain-containing protein [Streptomyces agglomeratus]OEJ59337.1 hypothetical protein BGM19_16420 [Streptomyces agglomeratus]